MDLEPYKPVAGGVILACFLGIAFLKFLAANKDARKRNAIAPLLGDYPMSPRPIKVDLDKVTARRKFLDGLRSMQTNQGWSIKSAGPDATDVTAVMRWSGEIRDYQTMDRRKAKVTSVNSVLNLKGQIITQGRQTLLQWTFDCDSSAWSSPDNHRIDPRAQDICVDTNLAILTSLGLISS